MEKTSNIEESIQSDKFGIDRIPELCMRLKQDEYYLKKRNKRFDFMNLTKEDHSFFIEEINNGGN